MIYSSFSIILSNNYSRHRAKRLFTHKRNFSLRRFANLCNNQKMGSSPPQGPSASLAMKVACRLALLYLRATMRKKPGCNLRFQHINQTLFVRFSLCVVVHATEGCAFFKADSRRGCYLQLTDGTGTHSEKRDELSICCSSDCPV